VRQIDTDLNKAANSGCDRDRNLRLTGFAEVTPATCSKGKGTKTRRLSPARASCRNTTADESGIVLIHVPIHLFMGSPFLMDDRRRRRLSCRCHSPRRRRSHTIDPRPVASSKEAPSGVANGHIPTVILMIVGCSCG